MLAAPLRLVTRSARVTGVALIAGAAFALAAPPSFRLPDDVVPKNYRVELTIDPSRPTFTGSVKIDVELKQATSVLWVNGKDLIVRNATISVPGRAMIARAQSAGGEFIGLELDAPIGPGPASISVEYQGKLDENGLAGLYRRKVAGKWYAYTTFTPIDARRAFPCFDEPRFKAPWTIALRVRKDNRAFSNGRQLSESDEPNGWKLVRFAETPPLPAEVVAFVAGPFDVLDGAPAGRETPIRIVTSKGRQNEGKIAAQAAVDVLPRIEEYAGIPYPFGKLDLVALPEESFGAVENPGLITFRAAGFLLAPFQSASARVRAIHALEAHEFAHQWFGDLVTQASWDDVWLSEGFATWMANKVMDREQPPARERLAAVMDRERILALDASRHLRPVRQMIGSRDSARDIYNRVVYEKAAAILLMLEGWLGEEHFRDGVRGYLQAHKFGNATADDLAAALKAASGSDPARVMHAFLEGSGVAQISGDVRCEKDVVSLRMAKSAPGPVPVCWRGDRIETTCSVVEGPSSEINLPKGTACPAWFYMNANGTGYYRSAWTQNSIEAIQHLNAAERMTLVYDLRGNKSDAAHRALLQLSVDAEPEIAAAARSAMK